MIDTVYILYTCDEWKSRCSFRFRGVYSTIEKAVDAINKDRETFFDPWDKRELSRSDLNDLNTTLPYGFLEEAVVDEE